MYSVKTYNQISDRGLSRFSTENYRVAADVDAADAILLRSHKLGEDELGEIRAVARAGAGTNNVPVDACTDKGIVVFNTPGERRVGKACRSRWSASHSKKKKR